MPGYVDIPLDLPHAGTIALRVQGFLEERTGVETVEYEKILEKAEELVDLLVACNARGENPPEPDATRIRDNAAAIGREIVELVERLDLRHDRLGQFIRNLFECLALGEEGAAISLRAGEDPGSLQRPL